MEREKQTGRQRERGRGRDYTLSLPLPLSYTEEEGVLPSACLTAILTIVGPFRKTCFWHPVVGIRDYFEFL
jgi:hypothetical protein